MPAARPDLVGDADRLSALDSYGLLDTPAEEGFDDIVQLASLACDTPVALVSLVAGDRQWFKARIGLQQSETDLNSSVCAHALDEADLLVIPDLRADPRTEANPLVTGEAHLRFYAGAPLRDRDGFVLGSLCVIDRAPRPEGLTARQAEMLRTLGRQMVALIELRRSVSGRDRFIAGRRLIEQQNSEDAARLRLSEAHWRGLFESLSEGFLVAEAVRAGDGAIVDWRCLDMNPAMMTMTGIAPGGGIAFGSVIGRTVREVIPGIGETWVSGLATVVATGEPGTFELQLEMPKRWFDARVFPLGADRLALLLIDVTARVQADVRRTALLELGDRLRDLVEVTEVTRTAAAIVGRAIGVSRVGFGRLDKTAEHVVVEPDWTAPGVASIAGRHRFSDFGEIRAELLKGEPLVIEDVLTDPRISGDTAAITGMEVRSLVNIPILERGRTMAILLAHDTRPRTWSPETIAFLRNVADRVMLAIARLNAETAQHLLNQELSHRMKNMLAVIQAIAMQTLKGVTEQDAVTGFRQRLQALASAQDVLLQKSWEEAPLEEVVRGVLERSTELGRFAMSGPAVMLGPRATLFVSLLVHELATNAVKHGALATEAGQVDVAWRVDPASDELVFTWVESGGPPVTEPVRRGFGSRLIKAGLLGTGGVTLRYEPAGFDAELRAGMEQVQSI